MKTFVAVLAVLAVAGAEAPRNRPRFGRQEDEAPGQAPYEPSGWKPEGARLQLPDRFSPRVPFAARQIADTMQPPSEYGPPPATYGPPPAPTYGPPSPSYGPPPETTEAPEEVTEIATEEPESESFKVTPLGEQRARQTAANTERGQYYLLLPDGRLQRVMYVTSADLKNMATNARLRYQNVEPIQGPIFADASVPFIPVAQ